MQPKIRKESPVSAKIIKLPINEQTDSFPTTRKAAKRRIANVKREFCETVLEDVVQGTFMHIASYQINPSIQTDAEMKRHIFVTEAIRAYLFHKAGQKHPFDAFIEDHIEINHDKP
jgi:hypothetical protein